MSHPAQSTTFVAPYTNRVTRMYKRCSGTILSQSSVTWGSPLYDESYERAATVKTIKDSTGWRPPTNYYAKRVRQAGPPPGGIQKTACNIYGTLDEVSGIQTNAGAMWPYSVGPGRTPMGYYSGTKTNNYVNFVKTKCITKLKNSDVNLGETFGERKETYRMVLGLLGEMTKFASLIRHGNIAGIRDEIMRTDPFSLWLQYRYGWRPLLKDIEAMLKAIEEKDNHSFERYRFYTKARVKVPYKESGSKVCDCSYFQWEITGDELAKARMDWKLVNPNYKTLAQYGLTPNVAWELTRLSFVVDWFVNVGAFLEAACLLPGWTFLGGSTTVVGNYKGVGKFLPKSPYVINTIPAPPDARYFQMQRITMSNPLPALAIDPNALNKLLSPVRITDAVALLLQQFGKR